MRFDRQRASQAHVVISGVPLSLGIIADSFNNRDCSGHPWSGLLTADMDPAHSPVSAGETALGSLCSPSRRVNETE